MFDEQLVSVERISEGEKGRRGAFLRACQAVHEHPVNKIVHRICHSFESSRLSTIWVSCEFALLAIYLLQSCHQEHSLVDARQVVCAFVLNW